MAARGTMTRSAMTRRTFRVRNTMSSPVVTAPRDATLEEVAERMLAERIGCVVVVDRTEPDVPVGIVTETDFHVDGGPVPSTFFEWPRVLGSFVWSERSLEDVYAVARRQPAESAMSSPVVTVPESAELWEAAKAMLDHDVKRLPVVRAGRLVGIVTRHDFLKCLVRRPGGPSRS